ncbi:MAG: hypothetical protein M1837_000399 [Sclerophora amabilis]|nr:MAG: hypothetical protein M1837_000399 [Sclerophora amabilis]
MSLSSQRHASPHTTAYTSSATATSQLNRSATPPSTALTSAQDSQPPILTTTNSFPTPASSVTGAGPSLTTPIKAEDKDEDVLMAENEERGESTNGPPTRELDDAMELDDGDHRRSDHNRQADHAHTDGTNPVNSAIAESKPTDGTGIKMEEREGALLPRGRPDLARLHADVGPLYLLCKSPHPLSRPHPTQDLLSLYSLQPLAATVSRTDPITGEKKKTRKTYKKYLQMFSLAGRNSEVSHPKDQPGGFEDIMAWPEEEWDNQKVAGKDVNDGLSDATLTKLERAMDLGPGPLPGFDASQLGLDVPSAKDAKKPLSQAPVVPQKSAQSNGGPSSVLSNGGESPPGDPARPKRVTKKRRYDERSFEGYGEGFADDDVDAAAAVYRSDSEKDDDRRGSMGKKKRKKVFLIMVLTVAKIAADVIPK